MSSDRNAFNVIGLSDQDTRETINRLEEEAPTAAALMQAMAKFGLETCANRDLYAETCDMRRSHLAVFIALADSVREGLAEVLAEVSLDDRLPDADIAAPIADGLDTLGEALIAVAEELNKTPERVR